MNDDLTERRDRANNAESRASAIVTRLEELWALEQEESKESVLLFNELGELVGEQNAFDRVAHFAN